MGSWLFVSSISSKFYLPLLLDDPERHHTETGRVVRRDCQKGGHEEGVGEKFEDYGCDRRSSTASFTGVILT